MSRVVEAFEVYTHINTYYVVSCSTHGGVFFPVVIPKQWHLTSIAVCIADISYWVSSASRSDGHSFCLLLLQLFYHIGTDIPLFQVYLEFQLDRYSTKSEIKSAIDRVYYHASLTATGDALSIMKSHVFSVSKGMRSDKSIPKVKSILPLDGCIVNLLDDQFIW